jgi:histidinol phosphatase-like enzyme (inositol monophosphatase family)
MTNLPPGAIEAAIAAADAAGAVIRPYFRSGIAADDKSDDSPVTMADRAAEQAIRHVMAARFPSFGVIGEELGDQRVGRFNWVVDPIDGTREFITGRPTFVTLIALVEDGVPVLGLIDQPIIGERWVAAEGKLDFSSRFGGRIGCRKRAALAEAELSCTGPEWFDAAQLAAFHRLEAACRRASWGDDAYAAGLVALGEIDVIAEAGHKPWDWAASVPIITAAGGTMCDWAGNALRLDAPHDGTVLILGDPSLKNAALAALQGA